MRAVRTETAVGDHLSILYEDNHVLGVVKPAGLLVQGDRTGDPTLLDRCKAYLKQKYDKPGNVFLGLVHRIDRPVSGVMVFARTSKAASRLARSFHDRLAEKMYLAIVTGEMAESEGTLHGFIERVRTSSRLVDEASATAREAVTDFRVLGHGRKQTLVELTPRTGRHHQLRLQLAHAGFPVVGDVRYGKGDPLPDRSIALHAARLSVPHPVKEERVVIVALPPDGAPWISFREAIRARLAQSQ